MCCTWAFVFGETYSGESSNPDSPIPRKHLWIIFPRIPLPIKIQDKYLY